jgi:hypothetical protein
MREAERAGALSIEERRLTAFRNDTNIIRIVAPEWRTWLRLRSGQGVGANSCSPRLQFFLFLYRSSLHQGSKRNSGNVIARSGPAVDGALEEYRRAGADYDIGTAERLRGEILAKKDVGQAPPASR